MYLEYHRVVVLCQFLCFWQEIVLVCTYLPYSCGVELVFWFWREIVFGVTYVHSVQYSCAVVFLKNDYSVFLF
jgi:hypothetical protein